MKTVSSVVAWAWLFVALFTGCYTHAMLDLSDQKERVYTHEIRFVVTKDGTKYLFDHDTPPVVVKDTIRGDARVPVTEGLMHVTAAIPITDVREIGVMEKEKTLTTVAIVSGVLVGTFLAIGIAFAIGGYHK